MFEPTLEDEIVCIQREIKMRERVYPRWVDTGKMKQEKADWEIKCMNAVLESLHRLKGLEK